MPPTYMLLSIFLFYSVVVPMIFAQKSGKNYPNSNIYAEQAHEELVVVPPVPTPAPIVTPPLPPMPTITPTPPLSPIIPSPAPITVPPIVKPQVQQQTIYKSAPEFTYSEEAIPAQPIVPIMIPPTSVPIVTPPIPISPPKSYPNIYEVAPPVETINIPPPPAPIIPAPIVSPPVIPTPPPQKIYEEYQEQEVVVIPPAPSPIIPAPIVTPPAITKPPVIQQVIYRQPLEFVYEEEVPPPIPVTPPAIVAPPILPPITPPPIVQPPTPTPVVITTPPPQTVTPVITPIVTPIVTPMPMPMPMPYPMPMPMPMPIIMPQQPTPVQENVIIENYYQNFNKEYIFEYFDHRNYENNFTSVENYYESIENIENRITNVQKVAKPKQYTKKAQHYTNVKYSSEEDFQNNFDFKYSTASGCEGWWIEDQVSLVFPYSSAFEWYRNHCYIIDSLTEEKFQVSRINFGTLRGKTLAYGDWVCKVKHEHWRFDFDSCQWSCLERRSNLHSLTVRFHQEYDIIYIYQRVI